MTEKLREPFAPHTMGLMPHERGPFNSVFFRRMEIPKKIIFTNDENLAILKGYKAIVYYGLDNNEVIIRITGHSAKGALDLINSLKEMKQDEIYGDNVGKKRRRK